ncbi:hypothetical protein V6N11_068196 [Hibiscus sabdariffa]|uniref:Uncharacterized protein n=1 Tax=Hibiscus sabdariffa TaxID=183260 RepID=A0ABR2SSX6_9ROSI
MNPKTFVEKGAKDLNGVVSKLDDENMSKKKSRFADTVLNAQQRELLAHCDMIMNCEVHPEMRIYWKEIRTVIPWRPITSMYHRAHILFEKDAKHRWTTKELNGKMRSYNFYKMDVSLLSSYCSAKRIEVCGPRKKMANVALCRSFSKISSRDSVCSAVGVLPLSVQYDFSIVEKSLKGASKNWESIDKGMSIDEVSPYYEIGETDFGDHGK